MDPLISRQGGGGGIFSSLQTLPLFSGIVESIPSSQKIPNVVKVTACSCPGKVTAPSCSFCSAEGRNFLPKLKLCMFLNLDMQPRAFPGTTSRLDWCCEKCSSKPPGEEWCLLLTHSCTWSWVSQQVDLANRLDKKSHKKLQTQFLTLFFFFSWGKMMLTGLLLYKIIRVILSLTP